MIKLKDSYISFWRNCLCDDSKTAIYGNKLRTYRTLKTAYCLENYLLSSNNSRIEISMRVVPDIRGQVQLVNNLASYRYKMYRVFISVLLEVSGMKILLK